MAKSSVDRHVSTINRFCEYFKETKGHKDLTYLNTPTLNAYIKGEFKKGEKQNYEAAYRNGTEIIRFA